MPDAANASESSSALSGIVRWAGGIAASVIAAVLIYHFTRPTPPPQSLDFYGVVADAASHALISNAKIVVSLGSNSVSQETDALGKYNVVLESAAPGSVMGDVTVSAGGYQEYSNTVPLQPGSNFAEITLQSVHPAPPAAAAAPGTGVAVPHVPLHVGIILRPPPPDFKKRASAAVMKLNH